MIYSRGLERPGWSISSHWDKSQFKPLKESRVHPGDVYYYDRHDLHQRKIEFDDFIDHEHWYSVRARRAKILIDYSDDYFNLDDLNSILETLIARAIPGDQVYFLTMDPNWSRFVQDRADQLELKIHIQDLPILMLRAVKNAPDMSEPPTDNRTRFSILSRNYRPWRLDLYLKLLHGQLLTQQDQFRYSFHDYEPYMKIHYKTGEILEDAAKLGYTGKDVKRWIKGLPYDLGNRSEKYAGGTYDAIARSDVHVLIESHFDAYICGLSSHIEAAKIYTPREWAPVFLTEKFYKPILARTPFVMVNTPYSLQEMRDCLGYRSFPELIPEEYDSVKLDGARMQAVYDSIVKVSQLSDEEFDRRRRLTMPAVEHNYNHLMEQYNQPRLTGEFRWLRSCANKTELPQAAL